MVALPQAGNGNSERESGGCGSSCGAGLEKIYPTTAVRYGAMNWIGEFSYKPGMVFRCGGKVVIESDRGLELGQQVSLTCNGCDKSVSREQIKRYVENSGPEFYRLGAGRILREATPQDLDEHAHLNACVKEDVNQCALLAAQLDLDMKIITAEHLLGGERIVFYFRSENRVDFRELVKELAHLYRTRIEMRQVGARDEARLVADYEVCGRECCCKNFLKKLRPVNMKMAKLQKSTLDPSKVSGRCGRLRCCLRYEHEGYEELNAKLPRTGTRVQTTHGLGVVIDRQILTQLLLIRTDAEREVVVPFEEVQLSDAPLPPPPQMVVRPGSPEPSVKPAGPERREARGEGPRDRRSDDSRPGRAPRVPHRDAPTRPAAPAVAESVPESAPSGEEEPGAAPPSAENALPSASDGPRKRRRRRRRRGGGAADDSSTRGADGGPPSSPSDAPSGDDPAL